VYAALLLIDTPTRISASLSADTRIVRTDGALGGIVARYSIIYTPPERLPEALAEFYRVLAPGGHLLLAFQAGEELPQLAEAFDHTVALAYRWSPDRVANLLRETGLTEVARLVIAAGEDSMRGFQQAHLLVRKPADVR
jgi:SAM-dependent methyltransferase